MKNFALLFFLLCTTGVLANPREDQVFDSHITDPDSLLETEYRNNRLLFIGTTDHSQYRHFPRLVELLRRVGNDPQLKFIIIERAYDISSFYENLSVYDLGTSLKNAPFKNEQAKWRSICEQPEWAYTIANFFPLLREINSQRKANPILVKTVDSISSTKELSWPGKDQPFESGNCPKTGGTLFMTSGTRELETAKNFTTSILNKMRSDEKVIILYHQAHLVRGITGCQSFMTDESGDNWVSNMGHFNWLGFVDETYPDLKKESSLVVMDQYDSSFLHNGVYKFITRQRLRYQKKEFAVPLKPFAGIIEENGLEAFEEFSHIMNFKNYFYRGQLYSHTSLPEAADGIILNNDAAKYQLLPAKNYLEYCAENNP